VSHGFVASTLPGMRIRTRYHIMPTSIPRVPDNGNRLGGTLGTRYWATGKTLDRHPTYHHVHASIHIKATVL